MFTVNKVLLCYKYKGIFAVNALSILSHGKILQYSQDYSQNWKTKNCKSQNAVNEVTNLHEYYMKIVPS